MKYHIEFTHQSLKDLKKITPKLREKVKSLCENILQETPYEGKKLMRELEGSFSLRISYKDRLVYSVDDKKKIVYVERCRTHYGE